MSSYDGGGFDEWVEDSFFGGRTNMDKIKALLEPYRSSIESALDGFEEDTMSWRTFRNSLWSYIPGEVQKQIDLID